MIITQKGNIIQLEPEVSDDALMLPRIKSILDGKYKKDSKFIKFLKRLGL
jgi:hypothetical protein